MIVSTRGRYALRVLIDLAESDGETYIPLKEIALRQGISQKYIEGIMTDLSKADLVTGRHGKGGGYKLARGGDKITVKDVLDITEGSLAPVSCLENKENVCERQTCCKTLPMWKEVDDLLNGYFSRKTVADLLRGE